MLTGGNNTRIPRGVAVSEPYDSLSFAPTILALTGRGEHRSDVVSKVSLVRFQRLPGRVIKELFDFDRETVTLSGGAPAGGGR
jgi:hypothetical protein